MRPKPWFSAIKYHLGHVPLVLKKKTIPLYPRNTDALRTVYTTLRNNARGTVTHAALSKPRGATTPRQHNGTSLRGLTAAL